MIEHSLHSSYREKLIEHLLIGELLKLSWRRQDFSLEISKPQVDKSGYDLIAETNNVIRHIQLKATFIGSTTAVHKVHVSLSKKPSGCVVLVYFNKETLDLGPYYFFGASAGKPLPNLEALRTAKHTKGDATGLKSERPNLRMLSKGSFVKLETISDLYRQLFGSV
ncbi:MULTISPECIES: hypothetical protein [Pseudomonas]|uniref:hypothetical protein n=1 Tax=Pseudomonas TaxID=286 RepID=UPI0030039DA2